MYGKPVAGFAPAINYARACAKVKRAPARARYASLFCLSGSACNERREKKRVRVSFTLRNFVVLFLIIIAESDCMCVPCVNNSNNKLQGRLIS